MENKISPFYLATSKIIPLTKLYNHGHAYIVQKNNFAALDGVTCFTLEIWEDSMRIPHWHPNASELGYVISGTIEIIIWRSPGESAVFVLKAGMCWFIPKAALHSLNNVGDTPAKLLVGFSSESPQDIDLPVALNGIPLPIRDAYTSPHNALRHWQGPIISPLVGGCSVDPHLKDVLTASPYGFDLAKNPPLFVDDKLGSVNWGIKDNWNILEDISMLRAHLKPNVARDPIWYPDVGTLYVVSQGEGEFHIIIAGEQPAPIKVSLYDYIYVPSGVLHTFINNSKKDFEVIAFFTGADPQPEVSLSVATSFFPNVVREAALNEYKPGLKKEDLLKHMNYTESTPYLIPLAELTKK